MAPQKRQDDDWEENVRKPRKRQRKTSKAWFLEYLQTAFGKLLENNLDYQALSPRSQADVNEGAGYLEEAGKAWLAARQKKPPPKLKLRARKKPATGTGTTAASTSTPATGAAQTQFIDPAILSAADWDIATSPYVTVTFRGLSRMFLQQNVSGEGNRCLWRALAASWFGDARRWDHVFERTRLHYMAAVGQDPNYLNSPLQRCRREAYENMFRFNPDLHNVLMTGANGTDDHVQMAADALDVEIYVYTPHVDPSPGGQHHIREWEFRVFGRRHAPARQIHLICYVRGNHWTSLRRTDLPLWDPRNPSPVFTTINNNDWNVMHDTDPFGLLPRDEIPRLPGLARLDGERAEWFGPADWGHHADFRGGSAPLATGTGPTVEAEAEVQPNTAIAENPPTAEPGAQGDDNDDHSSGSETHHVMAIETVSAVGGEMGATDIDERLDLFGEDLKGPVKPTVEDHTANLSREQMDLVQQKEHELSKQDRVSPCYHFGVTELHSSFHQLDTATDSPSSPADPLSLYKAFARHYYPSDPNHWYTVLHRVLRLWNAVLSTSRGDTLARRSRTNFYRRMRKAFPTLPSELSGARPASPDTAQILADAFGVAIYIHIPQFAPQDQEGPRVWQPLWRGEKRPDTPRALHFAYYPTLRQWTPLVPTGDVTYVSVDGIVYREEAETVDFSRLWAAEKLESIRHPLPNEPVPDALIRFYASETCGGAGKGKSDKRRKIFSLADAIPFAGEGIPNDALIRITPLLRDFSSAPPLSSASPTNLSITTPTLSTFEALRLTTPGSLRAKEAGIKLLAFHLRNLNAQLDARYLEGAAREKLARDIEAVLFLDVDAQEVEGVGVGEGDIVPALGLKAPRGLRLPVGFRGKGIGRGVRRSQRLRRRGG